MRATILFGAALVTLVALPASAQRGRRSDSGRTSGRDNGTTSEERFTPALRSGQRLSVSNIDGNVTVTQSRGNAAEIIARKVVRRGNGELIKPVLEEVSGGYRICTVYLNRAGDDRGCGDRNRGNNNNDHWDNNGLDAAINYEIRLPAGVALTVNTVDGNIDARGIDTPASIRSVDGSIDFEGVAPENMTTVDGSITAKISGSDWSHAMAVRTVDGDIELTLPAGSNARISGHTVDGQIDSDFPMTVTGKWGPQSFHGDIGSGRGPALELSTVDGSIRLHSSDGARRNGDRRRP